MKKILFIFLLLFSVFPEVVFSQTCPVGFHTSNFKVQGNVQILACVEDQVGATGQKVFWGAKNLTNDKLQITFTKVVYTTCGNVLRAKADTELKPGEVVTGSTFSGEMTFETQVWKEDCADKKNRISRIGYEDLTVKNISQEERDREAKQKQEEAKREQQEKERKEQERKNSTSNTVAQNRQAATSTASASGSSASSYSKPYNNSSSNNSAAITIIDNYNTQSQNNRHTADAVGDGLQQLGNAFQASVERKKAEREAQERVQEMREREENEKKAEQEKQEVAERNARYAEAFRQDEARQSELRKQESIDNQILGTPTNILYPKTANIPDNIKQVFYIIYERDYQTNQVEVKTYTLNKYSDDTWMLRSDVLKRLKFSEYFDTHGVGRLLGFFTTKTTVDTLLSQIKKQSPNANIDKRMLLLNGNVNSSTDMDFWNN